MSLPWVGPFKVLAALSDVTYRVQADSRGKQKILHFNRLKPYKGTDLPAWFTQKEPTADVNGARDGREEPPNVEGALARGPQSGDTATSPPSGFRSQAVTEKARNKKGTPPGCVSKRDGPWPSVCR